MHSWKPLAVASLLFPLLSACVATPDATPPASPPGAPSAAAPQSPPTPAPTPAQTRRQRLEADLAKARADFNADPMDELRIIWFGRRLAYLERYDEAIAVFTRGLELRPRSHKLLRHRGHRYITTRRFDKALADFTLAASIIEDVPDEVEPDGAPNALGIPTSTTNGNIYYHLALTRYLLGDFDAAAEAWRACLMGATNDDMRVAAGDWLYRALRRAGRDADAQEVLASFSGERRVIENHAYHRLLLMYKGEIDAAQVEQELSEGDGVQNATLAYGLANFLALEGEGARARALLREIAASESRGAFGVIAAEADLDRFPG